MISRLLFIIKAEFFYFIGKKYKKKAREYRTYYVQKAKPLTSIDLPALHRLSYAPSFCLTAKRTPIPCVVYRAGEAPQHTVVVDNAITHHRLVYNIYVSDERRGYTEKAFEYINYVIKNDLEPWVIK